MTSIKQLVAENKVAEAHLRGVTIGSWIGTLGATLLIGLWCIAAGWMLVGFGAWGWVVWPAMAYIWANRILTAAGQGMKQIAEAKAKLPTAA